MWSVITIKKVKKDQIPSSNVSSANVDLAAWMGSVSHPENYDDVDADRNVKLMNMTINI